MNELGFLPSGLSNSSSDRLQLRGLEQYLVVAWVSFVSRPLAHEIVPNVGADSDLPSCVLDRRHRADGGCKVLDGAA